MTGIKVESPRRVTLPWLCTRITQSFGKVPMPKELSVFYKTSKTKEYIIYMVPIIYIIYIIQYILYIHI